MFSRTYGIEIEAIAPAGISRDMIAARISEAGVPCYNANYTHRTTPEWKVVSDASLRTSGGGTTGMEFVSPPLSGEEGLEQVAKVSAVLLANGFTVNRSCGLHVHVAARNLPIAAMRKLMALYSKYEPVLDSFMPPSRRGNANTYCQSVARGTDMSVIAQAQSATEIARATQRGSRYVKLNFTSYWKHGTVEFRHHSGTVDASKINRWIKVVLLLVKMAVENPTLTLASSDRPRNRRLGRIYDLMASSPGLGVTRAQVADMLGRRTMPPLNKVLTRGGINYRELRIGRTAYYMLVQGVVTADSPATFDNFVSELGLDETDKAFWQTRREEFARREGAVQ